MSSASEAKHTLDWLKWLLVVGLAGAGIYLNMEYALASLLVRALVGIALAGVCAAIALQTAAGRSVWELAKEARIEIRRVVWPTRQETVQTTMIVVAVVIIVAIILWGLDSLLSWIVSSVIG
jgi:preprotein translocase subunit SecE